MLWMLKKYVASRTSGSVVPFRLFPEIEFARRFGLVAQRATRHVYMYVCLHVCMCIVVHDNRPPIRGRTTQWIAELSRLSGQSVFFFYETVLSSEKILLAIKEKRGKAVTDNGKSG